MSQASPNQPDSSPRPAEIRRSARAHFDKWALRYDRSRLNELVFFPAIRACQEEITRWQALRGGGPFRLLDVGCGTGTLINLLARRADAELLVGLDYSPVMARHLTEKIAQSPQAAKLHALVGDSEHLPFADETFDVVTCCNSFHHYPHQAAVVRGFHRVLRPGGLLVLVDGFRDNVVGWVIFDVAVAMVEKKVHHAAWSEIRDLIQAAGFSTLRQRKMNVLAPLLVNVARR
ncbi:MAG: methyltransferase domain-containing protein [Phycisphaerae bacterium]|nr:methyltransferase domain-containing protein [Phycisphaerae bacterium]